jgi:hypothetical protein
MQTDQITLQKELVQIFLVITTLLLTIKQDIEYISVFFFIILLLVYYIIISSKRKQSHILINILALMTAGFFSFILYITIGEEAISTSTNTLAPLLIPIELLLLGIIIAIILHVDPILSNGE